MSLFGTIFVILVNLNVNEIIMMPMFAYKTFHSLKNSEFKWDTSNNGLGRNLIKMR